MRFMPDPGPVDRLSRRLGETLSWLFYLAVALTAFEVVMRYVVNSPTVWVHDLVIAITAVAFVVGGAYALERSEHIRISSLYDRLPAGWRLWLDRVSLALITIYLALLTYSAARPALVSIALRETSGRAWDVPVPPILKTVLALGAALMTVQAALHLVRAFRRK
jgi:TRAP-type mannitol/chloroaromatic compound transport system permease small subunit